MCINRNVPSPKCAQLLNIPKHYISHSPLNQPLETPARGTKMQHADAYAIPGGNDWKTRVSRPVC